MITSASNKSIISSKSTGYLHRYQANWRDSFRTEKEHRDAEDIVNSPTSEKTVIQVQNQATNDGLLSNSGHHNSGISIKDQYLARSRYIAGQSTKNSYYRGAGRFVSL